MGLIAIPLFIALLLMIGDGAGSVSTNRIFPCIVIAGLTRNLCSAEAPASVVPVNEAPASYAKPELCLKDWT